MRTAGFILAGGKSSRMGQDKALLPYRGSTLVQHIAGFVAAVAGSATVVGRPAIYVGLNLPAIPDLYPHTGPLGGIVTALSSTTAIWNLVVACDLPAIDTSFLARLVETAIDGNALCLIPRTGDGQEHPLCAVYRSEALSILREQLLNGKRKLREAIRPLAPHWLELKDEKAVTNVNTRDEWLAYGASR